MDDDDNPESIQSSYLRLGQARTDYERGFRQLLFNEFLVLAS